MRPWDSSGQQVFCWSLIINPIVWKCFRMQGIFVTFPSADNCFQAPSSMRACSKIMGFMCTHIGSRPLPHTCHHVILDPGPGTVMKTAGRAQRCQRGRTHPEKLISLINCDRARFMSGFCSSTHFPKKGKNDIWHTSDTNPWGSGPGVAGGLGHSGMVKSHPLQNDALTDSSHIPWVSVCSGLNLPRKCPGVHFPTLEFSWPIAWAWPGKPDTFLLHSSENPPQMNCRHSPLQWGSGYTGFSLHHVMLLAEMQLWEEARSLTQRQPSHRPANSLEPNNTDHVSENQLNPLSGILNKNHAKKKKRKKMSTS